MITKQSVKISIVVTGQSLLSGGCVFKEAAPPTSRGIRRADRASIVPLLADRRQGMVLCLDCVSFQLCARAPAGARSGVMRNPAMPLPVAEEGIAGLLQRSENRRNSVSPNDSPGTAKRVVEGFPSQNHR